MSERRCSVEGCTQKYACRGYCERHYQNFRKHGDPLHQRPDATMRFFAKVDQLGTPSSYRPDLGNCWLWTSSVNEKGYGLFFLVASRDLSKRQVVLAHKWHWERENGPVPDGLELDHLCRVRPCVRIDHLEPVTHHENMIRAAAAITHCPEGHPYAGDNVFFDGHCRRCRTCVRRTHRESERRRRARLRR